ncbi:hypothetical protein RND81_09G092900 [Saponaria officinalis]|uniref:Aminotransferase-like plant mobile domain-containing protein n=1 Tax=Saponaria officinalis TaxID=3572 RepID=A0AAW1IK21_SAPOF
MVSFLLTAYDGVSRRFHVDALRECFLSPYDVHDVFMLPCNTSMKVKLTSTKRKDNPDVELVQLWKEQFGLTGNQELYAETIYNEMIAMTDGGDDFKWFFVLYAFGTLLAPTPHNMVDLHLLKAVQNVEEIREQDWCDYVLLKLGVAIDYWICSCIIQK